MTTTIAPNAPPWSRLVDALQAEIRRKDAAIEELRAENERLRETLRGIRDANWRTWDNATADEFVAWAQSRARHVLADHADAYMDAPVTASERTRELIADARRYRWLKERLHGVDFDYMDADNCANSVIVFKIDDEVRMSGNLDLSIDAAIAQEQK